MMQIVFPDIWNTPLHSGLVKLIKKYYAILTNWVEALCTSDVIEPHNISECKLFQLVNDYESGWKEYPSIKWLTRHTQ